MQDNPLPQEDQLVTMVSVRNGNIYVSSALVLVVKPTTIALQLDRKLAEPPDFDTAQPLTVLYARGDRVMRLKAVVRERIDEERITVEPVGDVKEGDRRDYRRADIVARFYCRAGGDDAAVVREQQIRDAIDPSDDAFVEQTINLSGSGISCEGATEHPAGTLLDCRVLLPLPTPTLVTMVSEVVRCDPTGDGRFRSALRFQQISEHDQDLVVYMVFSRLFEGEGLMEDLELPV